MDDHSSRRVTPVWFTPVLCRLALTGALGLLTLAVFAAVVHARRVLDYPPLSPGDLVDVGFDAYEVGVVFQEVVAPLAVIYLFSGTAAFRRIVCDQATWRDRLALFGLLALVQFLMLNYALLADELATFGVLTIVAAGLLGGWRMGLGVGLVTMLILGTQESILYPDEDLLRAFETQDWQSLLAPSLWGNVFLWYYVADFSVSSAVWAGLVAGLAARVLGERRFVPLIALGVGTIVSLGVGLLATFSWEYPADLIVYLIPGSLISGVAVAGLALIVHSVRARVVEREAEAAELALARAELRALRAQINPHFLFNALNTIRYFVRTDAATARRLVLDLSAIFQHVLRSGEFVSLREEIRYVEAYLTLEQTRLDDRLQVAWSVAVEQALDHPIPTLILQPIVENAIVHGVSKQPEGGVVRIDIARVEDELVLQVSDDGPGIPPDRLVEVLGPEESGSIGLRNVDGRLRALYGEAYRLDIDSNVGEGTRVRIRIPLEG